MKKVRIVSWVLALGASLLSLPVWAGETVSQKEAIEAALNLANNEDQEWSYTADADAWVLSVVPAVAYPVIENEEGVSVCVPGAYVKGIDTNRNGEADVTAASYTEAIKGSLVIDYEASIISTNGQTYSAATAPVIINTGAAGYGNSSNTKAGTTYAKEGYINVACGNRGKQDSYTDADGNIVYTGDAPSCLSDQKAAARFVKYNILLGNLPGSVDYWVSTGGSGGGAHATMFAGTSNNPDFYDYQIEVGTVGVYRNEDGSYCTSVTIDGEEVELSDGAWGCVAYSAITSLYEADMALAFEYTLNNDYSWGTEFQKALAFYLSQEYMEYINGQNLTVEEAAVGFDLDGDGALSSTVALTIDYDPEAFAANGGYGGTYLDLYLAEFIDNLQWYLDNLDYATDWTWFDSEGNALRDDAVSSMTSLEKAQAFLEGRYAKGSSGGMRGPGKGMGEGLGGGMGRPNGEMGQEPGEGREMHGEMGRPGQETGEGPGEMGEITDPSGDEMVVGTPDAGTTQASGSTVNSNNYATFEEMLAAYEADIAEIEAGDAYGKNLVTLYDPLHYIGLEGTEDPAWSIIVCGASEGDISMFNSLNLELAFLKAGVKSQIEWQWDGGHVPSETLGNSLALRVDQMYGEYVEGAAPIEKAQAEPVAVNGTVESASGTDISSWVTLGDDGKVAFSLADAAAYRAKGASKACPAFDVIDYGQEDYVFGDLDTDARHWSIWVLKAMREYAEELSALF